MKKYIVTPAGRKKYLEILAAHLVEQKDEFDEWQIWANTENLDDLAYIDFLRVRYPWVRVFPSVLKVDRWLTIRQFFTHLEEDAVYLRLDDDIVWMEEGFVGKMFDFRLQNPEYFLIYANILNNSVIDHIRQRKGLLPPQPFISYQPFCKNGWASGSLAEIKHRVLLQHIQENRIAEHHLGKWIFLENEWVTVNAVAWFGYDLYPFKDQVEPEEEPYIAVKLPKLLGRVNCLHGDALCSHYSFHSQIDLMKDSDVLDSYRALVNL